MFEPFFDFSENNKIIFHAVKSYRACNKVSFNHTIINKKLRNTSCFDKN